MRIGLTALVAASTGLVLLAACSTTPQAAATTPKPAQTSATVTLTETGCVFDGPGQMPAGKLTLLAVNQTPDQFWIGSTRIESPHTYAELAVWVAEDNARQKAGLEPHGPPPYAPVTQDFTIAQARDERTIQVSAGTWTIACGRIRGRTSLGIWVTGPFTVSG